MTDVIITIFFILSELHISRMKKLSFLLFLLFLASCSQKPADSYFTTEKALQYFSSIEQICREDSGKLWGENLYGPLMFVDRATRRIMANQPDAVGLLRGKDGVYTGIYPREQVISNTPVTFGGREFSSVALPPEEDAYRIKSRAIHVLFHSFQLRRGIQPRLFNQVNMDDKTARLWIKLEWKALQKALHSHGNERLIAIRDALVFRGANRELYQNYAAEANRYETNEGLATFTYIKMLSADTEERTSRLLETLDRVYSMPSYARSYGSIHGALYASLLYDAGYDFRVLNADTTDLGKVVRQVYNIELPSICRDVAGSLALSYDFNSLTREEEERSRNIAARLKELTSTFTGKDVVYLELESPYFDFEPEDIHPVDTLGTLYNALRVSDSWGKLSVDLGGCLVSNNYKYMRITAKGFRADKNRISGEGWNIILNDGWEFVPVKQDYFLRKVIPF